MVDKIAVEGFRNRGTEEHPFGFIEFNDGMRIGYSPGARGTNEDGLFNCQQPYLLAHLDLRAAHITAATKYVREVLQPMQNAKEK
jgi:hypothetical protein